MSQLDSLTCREACESYETLGIQAWSSLAEVKRQYRILVRKFHPDHIHSTREDRVRGEERLKLINPAYSRLVRLLTSDPDAPDRLRRQATSDEERRQQAERDRAAHAEQQRRAEAEAKARDEAEKLRRREERAAELRVRAAARARRLRIGRIVEKLKKQAEWGFVESQYLLGELFDSGHLVKKQPRNATVWYKLAAEQGHLNACSRLVYLFRHGARGVKPSAKAASKWAELEHRIRDGHFDNCKPTVVDNIFPRTGESDEKERALFSKLRSLAEAGDAELQRMLRQVDKGQSGIARLEYFIATLFASGRVAPKDEMLAAKWYSLAAYLGHAGAKAELVAKIKKQAEMGIVDFQYMLGQVFDFGHIVKPSISDAAKWYRLAADQGHIHAFERLAVILKWNYRDCGKPVTADEQRSSVVVTDKGEIFLRSAASDEKEKVLFATIRSRSEAGDLDCQRALAQTSLGKSGLAKFSYFVSQLFYSGRIASRDETLGEKWLRMAADYGHVKAQNDFAAICELRAP